MAQQDHLRHRLERSHGHSLRNWDASGEWTDCLSDKEVLLDCGWGQLIFGQTFTDSEKLAQTLCKEAQGKRNIAFYVRDPHVIVSLAPQDIFIDPSHTYRLWLDRYRPAARQTRGFVVRLLSSYEDAKRIQEVYLKRQMIPLGTEFIWDRRKSRKMTLVIAEEEVTKNIIGVAHGVDHYEVFNDPENGTSLWALAVEPQAMYPGIGEALVRQLAEHYSARGRSFMDVSVMHDNKQAIALYDKLDFKRVPVFALKSKNAYNEPLFIAQPPEEQLNPYAKIIIKEARRRGIGVEVLDEIASYFALHLGGRRIICRESLTELTTAIAMSQCDDKAVTCRLLAQHGLKVPAQITAQSETENNAFLNKYQRIVVKPARGEQGAGISVDVRTPADLKKALEYASRVNKQVLLEQLIEGEDLRIIVIDFKVVAAATRQPAQIRGTGHHTIVELIEKQSRRRAAATGGESHIPVDAETIRCVREAGYQMDEVLPEGEKLFVRKTANLHTGGTIHDVTKQLNQVLRQAAEKAAQVLNIPVVGFDFLIPSVEGEEYTIIEANERPGLANHEPQPTAERFIDFLFPQTVSENN
jgi:GNAT-family acetyltransferase (TIGR03103 family)